jgi:hypothetical protein
MNTKTTTIFILVMSLMLSGCGLGQLRSTLTPTPTPTSTSTSTPKPTPQPFTSPVTVGAWVGDISIPLDLNKHESANVRLLISENGKTIDYYQLYLTSCSLVIGDQSIPINQGIFSFSIDQSCNFTGTISISGIFVSETKLEGIIKAGSQTSYWEATPAK